MLMETAELAHHLGNIEEYR